MCWINTHRVYLWKSYTRSRHHLWYGNLPSSKLRLVFNFGQTEVNHKLCSSIKSLWPSDTRWWQRSGWTFVQLMAFCLMAPSRYMNQCWLIIREVLWYSPEGNYTGTAQDTHPWHQIYNYQFQITVTSPRGQWVIPVNGGYMKFEHCTVLWMWCDVKWKFLIMLSPCNAYHN